MVPVRKAGKLPPPTIRRAYDLEYGTAEIEVPTDVLDGRRVYLVDDVLATGGTVRAAAELIAQGGGLLAGIGVLLELGFLNGRERLEGIAHGEVGPCCAPDTSTGGMRSTRAGPLGGTSLARSA